MRNGLRCLLYLKIQEIAYYRSLNFPHESKLNNWLTAEREVLTYYDTNTN